MYLHLQKTSCISFTIFFCTSSTHFLKIFTIVEKYVDFFVVEIMPIADAQLKGEN